VVLIEGVNRVKIGMILPVLALWVGSAAQVLAQGTRGPASAPEIDGPGGVAAIALLVGAGLIAYHRFRK
jgi:hypothetical protein